MQALSAANNMHYFYPNGREAELALNRRWQDITQQQWASVPSENVQLQVMFGRTIQVSKCELSNSQGALPSPFHSGIQMQTLNLTV